MTKPKAIFFDMDETLIENTISFPALFEQLYIEQADVLDHHNYAAFIEHFRAHAQGLWASMFEFETSPEAQLAKLYGESIYATGAVDKVHAEQMGEAMLQRFIEVSAAQVRFNPGAEQVMIGLREQGFSTGLITNGIEAIQLAKVRALKLHEKLDSITVSAQARAHKPQAAVFDLALSRANVQAHEAWQVGDHALNDVAGGIRSGLGGVYYNPNKKDVEESFQNLQERPTHTIETLSDLLKLV